MRTISILIISAVLTAGSCMPQDAAAAVGRIYGTVVTTDGSGNQINVPHADVTLFGPSQSKVISDGSGFYSFAKLPPGLYAITATAPGLTGQASVQLKQSAGVLLNVQMHILATRSTVTIHGTPESIPAGASAQNVTINSATVQNAPNSTERIENLLPLVPGVVRGPNGLINMKGARASQNGSLVNSADVTDPATGATAISIPIDVVSSVEVLSTPYDPEYGKFVGAVSNVETRPGDFTTFRFTFQNLLPRLRRVDGAVMGIAAATPRLMFSGPLIKNRIAFTQSLEYRYERDPVDSLPPLQRWTRSETFTSYSQLDFNISPKQTATASFVLFPQKLNYYRLNTFTPQPSTPTLHERGYQGYLQHRYVTDSAQLVTSQVSFRRFDTDVLPNSASPYELLVETTKGGFFNHQNRDTTRTEWKEIFRSHPYRFFGSHELDAGIEYAHSSYDGRQEFLPVWIYGVSGYPLEQIEFGPTSMFSVDQNETSWFAGDKWGASGRLTLDLGLRFHRDSVTESVTTAPRAGFVLALTSHHRTVLKGGAGLFYDRVPLDIPAFRYLPPRTVNTFNASGETTSSTKYSNVIPVGLRNPLSEVWNLEVDDKVTNDLLVRVAYQQRNTVHDSLLNSISYGDTGHLSLADDGSDFYQEFQITGRYQIHHSTLNASYVHSRTFGDLNDVNQFIGNDPQPVIQPNERGRLNFDAPNRVLAWGEIVAPWKVNVAPVLDTHTGFPYSRINQYREFIGPRNDLRFPRFVSADVQVWRDISLPIEEKHARIGFGVFNVFNHPNYRDVQDDIDSNRYGEFFNGFGRTFHGKFVLEF